MAKTHRIRVASEIAAPATVVWNRVSAHEDTPSWVDIVKQVTLEQEGQPRNGVGAIRLVAFKPRLWTPVRERITHFAPPHEFRYVVLAGMPALRSHLGKVIVDDLGAGRSRARWEVDFVFRPLHPFRLIVPSFLRTFEAALTAGLANLKSQLEQAQGNARRASA
jgi:hypothetical protein